MSAVALVLMASPVVVFVVSRQIWPVCSCEMAWGRDPCCRAKSGECWFDAHGWNLVE